jgi:hypothetical protein
MSSRIPKMKTAGIVADAWKLPIFRRHLQEANFTFTEHSFGVEVTLLTVSYSPETERLLHETVSAAQAECDLQRAQSAKATKH